jgi:alpha-tubulin suppressor-like RCC1 family protein
LAKLNKDGISCIVKDNVDEVLAIANTEPNDVLFTFFSAGKLGEKSSISTLSTLQDSENPDIPEGHIIYADTINIPVILNNCCWFSLDGKFVAGYKPFSRVFSWGFGTCGGLGDGTLVAKSSPVQEISVSTNWCQVAAGDSHSSAVKVDGTLWSWGSGNCGRLGDGVLANKCSPVQEISSSTNWCQVSAGGRISAAIKTEGTLWSWGQGTCGRLGDGTLVAKCSPVQELCSSENWCQVSGAEFHSAAVKTDGTLWSWGGNANGLLGDGTIVTRTSPVQEISASTNWCQVSAGNFHSSAVKTEGTLWGWGQGTCGRLGDGTLVAKSSPVQEISGSTDWCQVSAGFNHSAAVKTDGTLWSWGSGACGRLGDGVLANKCSPVQEISASTNWCQVSAASQRSSAIKLDGTLWGWGRNYCGVLGDGTIVDKCSPAQEISGTNNWRQVSGGGFHSAASDIRAIFKVWDE